MSYEYTMTLWTNSKEFDSNIIQEAYSTNCNSCYNYVNFSNKVTIQDVIKDGWKLFEPPKKENKYYKWWFFKHKS
jgi:hypothetical protein